MKIGGAKKSKTKQSTAFTFKSSNNNKKGNVTNSRNPLSNVFGAPEVEQESSSQPISIRQSLNRAAKQKKTQRELAKVVKEDPSVFQYDELYDSFQQQRDAAFREKEIEKTLRPVRYLDTIQKVAEKRQIRYDAARERLLLKERKTTDHLFEDKQKYITRAYREKLKEIEQQRLKDKEQTEQERTVQDEEGMNEFFNGYLKRRTGATKHDRNLKGNHCPKEKGNGRNAQNIESKDCADRLERSQSKSRSRSRSRERTKEIVEKAKDDGGNTVDEVERYHIEKYQEELRKKTFDDEKRKEMESLALKKCEKRTTKSDIERLRERYLKRKQNKNGRE